MNLYYKAVRPDGTDFYSGTVDYASLSLTGDRLPRLPGGDCCGPGVYHASDVPAETLVGGVWPCRLFAVTGRPVAQAGHKFGFRTLRVVGELEAWQALGPNGKDVVKLIDRAEACTPQQSAALAAAMDAATSLTVKLCVRGAARNAARNAALAAAMGAARAAAWNAVWDAVCALCIRDVITPEQFDILYGPWASVMDNDEGVQ